MRRFFLEKNSLVGEEVTISGPDSKHIAGVLRLKENEVLGLFDSEGFEYTAKIKSTGKDRIDLIILTKKKSALESPVKIAVAQSFLKDKKMDTILRQLTELGITDFIPFFSKRSIPSPDKKRLKKRAERWSKITLESVKQCERAKVPEIHDAVSFDQLLKLSEDYDGKIAFIERKDGTQLIKDNQKTIIIVIGPEGGFSSAETEKLLSEGFTPATLGPRILKAETAAIAGATVVQYVFGDLCAP